MAVHRLTERIRSYRLLIAVIVIAAGIVLAFALAPATTDAAATVQVDEVHVDGTEHTVNEDIQDVLMGAVIAYDYDVEDADQWTVNLKAGPSENDLETVAWDYDDRPPGERSGTLELEGSLLDTQAFTADDLQPPLADTRETELVVAVEFVVDRENGEEIVAQETEDVTLTIHDGGTVEASVGGDVTFTVET